MPHRLCLKFADRLLLIARSVSEAEFLFQHRRHLLDMYQVLWIECWFCTPDLDLLAPVFIDGRDAPMESLYSG